MKCEGDNCKAVMMKQMWMTMEVSRLMMRGMTEHGDDDFLTSKYSTNKITELIYYLDFVSFSGEPRTVCVLSDFIKSVHRAMPRGARLMHFKEVVDWVQCDGCDRYIHHFFC